MEARVPGRVFVSSTCHDLIDLRAVLDQRLRDAGLTPILSDRPASEFKAPGDRNTIDTCLVNLRSCEACIVVLSQRYGSLVPDGPYKGKSVTHAEYLEAVNCGIPVQFYVRSSLLGAYWQSKRKLGARPDGIEESEWESLRAFIADRENQGSNSPYWIASFSDAVELGHRVIADLGRVSSNATIRMLVQQNRLPLISVHCVQELSEVLKFEVKNMGPGVAVHFRITDLQGYASNPGVDCPEGAILMHSARFRREWADASGRTAPVMRVDYEIITGERITELFAVIFDPQPRVVPVSRAATGISLRMKQIEAAKSNGFQVIDLSDVGLSPHARASTPGAV